MPPMQYASTPLEVVELKAGQDGWSFSAYASTFSNRDLGGDIMMPGAFTKTLTKSGFRPLLWQHDMREPIGIEKSLKQDGKGLLGSWELVDTQRGTDAYKLLKRGAVRSMSIGYMVDDADMDKDGARMLKSVELVENSIVSIPMNNQALIQSVKHCTVCAEHISEIAETLVNPLNTDAAFDDLMAQVKGHVMQALDEAEALNERRAAEQRKLSDTHIDALRLLQDELKGSTSRIEAILTAPLRSSRLEGPSPLRLRIETARRRLRAAGVETTVQ